MTPSYQLEMLNYLSGLLSNFLGAGNMQNAIAKGWMKIPWWLIPVQLRPRRAAGRRSGLSAGPSAPSILLGPLTPCTLSIQSTLWT